MPRLGTVALWIAGAAYARCELPAVRDARRVCCPVPPADGGFGARRRDAPCQSPVLPERGRAGRPCAANARAADHRSDRARGRTIRGRHVNPQTVPSASASGRGSRRLIKLAATFCGTAIALIVAVAVVELWVRMSWDDKRGRPGFYLSDPVLGQRLAPDYEGWF